MNDHRSLEECGVRNKSTIAIKTRLKGGCFPGYAPITLKDCTTKAISNININDELLSYDDKQNKFVINKVISIKVGKAKNLI